jgi:hypothetical protein
MTNVATTRKLEVSSHKFKTIRMCLQVSSSSENENKTAVLLRLLPILHEACPESKYTKVLNMYIFNLQKRHCE